MIPGIGITRLYSRKQQLKLTLIIITKTCYIYNYIDTNKDSHHMDASRQSKLHVH